MLNKQNGDLRRVVSQFCLLLILSYSLLSPSIGWAAPLPALQNQADERITPGQLIEAVNNLRLENGLHPLVVHSILMQTAQQQANALYATEGAVGHARPGGMTYTDQLISLGYPLAGDLSLGGYRSENWIWIHPEMTLEDAIQSWLGDAPHTNTMLSPNYEDIGAGVAFDRDGTGYLVIDTAKPTASGQPQPYTPEAPLYPPGSTPGAVDWSDYMQPIILSTARPDGDVIHEVLFGQTLWSIAIAYDTKIKEIQRLNNLFDETVYTGQLLLIQKEATQPAPEPATAAVNSTEIPNNNAAAMRITSATRTPHPNRMAQTASPTSLPKSAGETTISNKPAGLSWVQIAASTFIFLGVIGGIVILITHLQKD